MIRPKTSNLSSVVRRWNDYKLPTNLSGKSFLDAGTWAGGFCKIAISKGSKNVLGIDYVPPQKEDFPFLQCDIFSNKFLELKRYDIVLCAGVLYHVENVVELLYRLKLKTNDLLVLETEIDPTNNSPSMQFCASDSYRDNFSNWWIPSKSCVIEMLKACEFKDVQVVWEEGCRACFHAVPDNITCQKLLPREKGLMDI